MDPNQNEDMTPDKAKEALPILEAKLRLQKEALDKAELFSAECKAIYDRTIEDTRYLAEKSRSLHAELSDLRPRLQTELCELHDDCDVQGFCLPRREGTTTQGLD